MVNHATALNYHMYTSSLHWSGVQLCTQQWTVESGQIATVCTWEHIAVGKGFLLLLGSRHQIEEVPNLSSICAANCETKYPHEAPVQIKSVHFSKLHLVQVHLDPAQGCQPIWPPAQTIGNQSHPILPSLTI